MEYGSLQPSLLLWELTCHMGLYSIVLAATQQRWNFRLYSSYEGWYSV